MKRSVAILIAVLALLLGYSQPGQADFRGGVWIGPVWGPGWWGPTFGYSYPYGHSYPYGYGYPYYRSPPIVIQQEPQQYIYQSSPQTEKQYWYYCVDPQGFYPYVKRCPNGWMRVVPTPAPPERKD